MGLAMHLLDLVHQWQIQSTEMWLVQVLFGLTDREMEIFDGRSFNSCALH